MSSFKYDVVTLIELVESKPCIWDKTNENNKNKILREKSWLEIFQFLEDGYKQLNNAEKKKTGAMIMSKWSNIRDSFLKSMRVKTGDGARKTYIYSEHLQFLLKCAKKDDTESNFGESNFQDNPDKVEQSLPAMEPKPVSQVVVASTPTTSKDTRALSRTKKGLDPIEREILNEIKKSKFSEAPRQECRPDNETLLLSFAPYTRDMSEFELMELQMEVLRVIKRIKEQRSSQHSFTNPVFQRQLHLFDNNSSQRDIYQQSSLSPSTVTSAHQSHSQSPLYPLPSPASIINTESNHSTDQSHQSLGINAEQDLPEKRVGENSYTLINPYQKIFDECLE